VLIRWSVQFLQPLSCVRIVGAKLQRLLEALDGAFFVASLRASFA
jgi:hypothetical protein